MLVTQRLPLRVCAIPRAKRLSIAMMCIPVVTRRSRAEGCPECVPRCYPGPNPGESPYLVGSQMWNPVHACGGSDPRADSSRNSRNTAHTHSTSARRISLRTDLRGFVLTTGNLATRRRGHTETDPTWTGRGRMGGVMSYKMRSRHTHRRAREVVPRFWREASPRVRHHGAHYNDIIYDDALQMRTTTIPPLRCRIQRVM